MASISRRYNRTLTLFGQNEGMLCDVVKLPEYILCSNDYNIDNISCSSNLDDDKLMSASDANIFCFNGDLPLINSARNKRENYLLLAAYKKPLMQFSDRFLDQIENVKTALGLNTNNEYVAACWHGNNNNNSKNPCGGVQVLFHSH